MDIQRVLEATGTALVIATTLGISRWSVRTVKARTEMEQERDDKIDRLLEYHEGTPAEPLMGRPAVPGIQERIERIEAEITPNGGDAGTLGDRVERTEKMSTEAAHQVAQLIALAKSHRADHDVFMAVRDLNERAFLAAMKKAGIDVPGYLEHPEVPIREVTEGDGP